MPEVKFGGKDGTVLQLREDPDLLVVRTRSRRSLRGGPVPTPEADVVKGLDLVSAFPEAGVEVYRRPEGAAGSTADVRSALETFDDVRFAGRVLVNESSGEPAVYTENLFVKFRDDVDAAECERILENAGLTIKETEPYATNAYFVAAPEGTGQEVFEIADRLLALPQVELCHPELIQRARKRAVFSQQWHLAPTRIGGVDIDASANVQAAHAHSLGEGATIAVLDDGFDLGHPEFATAGKIVAPRDFTPSLIDSDPAPGNNDNHGTACAGVACADGRDGASGVAPRAKLLPIRMPRGIGSMREADAFRWAADHGADVISCSWGPPCGKWWDPDDAIHDQVVPLPDSTRLAIDHAVTNGRDGRGCVIFWAAGNGNESVDNDGYAAYEKVIAVAACNDTGRKSVYSDFGDAIWCCFPSNDAAVEGEPAPLTPGIWTTDRSGREGYNPGNRTLGDPGGDYVNSFGGTSSACPGMAGVAGLVLSQNPKLAWDEVRDVIKESCDRIDDTPGEYVNGRSPKYGWGRANAGAAVALASPSGGSSR